MRTPRLLLILLLVLSFPGLPGQNPVKEVAQEQYDRFDKLYGLDPNLMNGVLYRIKFPDTKGHPFLDEENFTTGSIRIGKRWYRDVMLAYNIYNQEVILKYLNSFGGSEYVVLHNDFIDEFWLGLRRFEKLNFSLTGEQFFQVIDAGRLKCCYRWSKSINESVYPYAFWEPIRKFYLLKDNEIHAFQSKGSFIELFDRRNRKSIKIHFKKAKIKLKQISDKEMLELLQYCIELDDE